MATTQISFSQLQGHTGNFKSIQEFGGVGDGVTDNTTALQAAANAPMPVYFPPGVYNCSGNITQTKKSCHWFGHKFNTFDDDQTAESKKISKIVYTGGDSGTLFETTIFVDAGTVFENLVFDFANDRTTDHFGIKFGPDENQTDRDVKILNCMLINFGTAILLYGRGLLVKNCIIVSGYHAVDFDATDPWVPPSGNFTSHQLETGMRSNRISSCRFHDLAGDAVIRSIGYNQRHVTSIIVSDCHSESVSGVFQGGGRHLTFTGNVFHAIDERPIFDFWDVDNVTIAGNTFAGEYDLDDDDTVRHEHDPWYLVRGNQDYSSAARTSFFGDHPYPYQASVTITRSGSTATVAHTAHGLANEQYVLIAGANETEYNGTHQIFNVSTNSYDYNVSGTPATPATGTITSTGIFKQMAVTVTGNGVSGVYKDVFQLKSEWENITITGNGFYDVCRVSHNTGLDNGQVGHFISIEHKGRGLTVCGNSIQAANPSGGWTRKGALIDSTGLSSTDYEDFVIGDNSWTEDHWTRESTLLPVNKSAGSTTWYTSHAGNGTDPYTVTPPFVPSAAHVSCISGTNVGLALSTVYGFPSTGDIRINGFNIELRNNFNASGDTYVVICWK